MRFLDNGINVKLTGKSCRQNYCGKTYFAQLIRGRNIYHRYDPMVKETSIYPTIVDESLRN